MLEQYEERIENVKNKRWKMLERFHIGDYVYPFWFKNFVVYGTVIDIDTAAHKIICDFNGVRRQFDPEDLMLLNPDLANKKGMKKASFNRVVNAVYYHSSPSQYKMSNEEKETGEATCSKCGGLLQPSFNAETKTTSLVCSKCGKVYDESNIVE